MDVLLNTLKTAIKDATALAYLQAVEVIEDETFVPEEPGFPLVGLIDGGTVPRSMPGKKDIETLTVGVVAFQSIALDEPGASSRYFFFADPPESRAPAIRFRRRRAGSGLRPRA